MITKEGGSPMSDLEYADRMERKYQKTIEETQEDENARKIHKFFVGSLKPDDQQIIKKMKEEYIQ
jgi:hypothetical protein